MQVERVVQPMFYIVWDIDLVGLALGFGWQTKILGQLGVESAYHGLKLAAGTENLVADALDVAGKVAVYAQVEVAAILGRQQPSWPIGPANPGA